MNLVVYDADDSVKCTGAVQMEGVKRWVVKFIQIQS